MQGRHLALAQLRQIRGDLLCTRVIALQLGLTDAHAARAHQLVNKIVHAFLPGGIPMLQIDIPHFFAEEFLRDDRSSREEYNGSLFRALTDEEKEVNI
jgi:hypothetical protein